MHPNEPLQFPPHYPPVDKWKRFFLGVRWLGPDLSFFKDLRIQQGARDPVLMDQWGGGIRQQTAADIGAIFARRLRWPSSCFLPDDHIAVIASGPRFSSMDGDLDTEEAIREIEEHLGTALPRSFWIRMASARFSELVDRILLARQGPDSDGCLQR